MSLHSPLSPSPELSGTLIDEMLPPRRPIERMSSHPSLSHSSTTATSDDPHESLAGTSGEIMTPVDPSFIGTGVVIHDEEQELLSPTHDRRGFRGITKSMQSLRGRAKADKERSRSTSRERPPVPLVEPGLKVAAMNRPTQPIAIPSATVQPVRPKPQRSSSSFSSFIRKLTGKSAKPVTPVPATLASPPRPSRAPTARPSPPSRKPTLAIDTGSAASTVRPAHARKTSLPLDLAIAIPTEKPLEPAPLTAPARAPTMKLVDPRTVPLPPSPPSPAVALANVEDLDFSLSPTSYDRTAIGHLSVPSGSAGRKQTNIVEDDEDSAEESDDVVNPLPSSSTQATGRISTSPVSTLNDPDVRTPLSPSFPQNRDVHSSSPVAAMSGGSPPKQPPQLFVNTAGAPRRDAGANLGRKESKWRKSVMNLSETLNGQSKRVSKAPPSSYDAYQQHQQRLANNRRSCAPTLHSTGSVSAEIRQIKDKDQQDMADTFFLS